MKRSHGPMHKVRTQGEPCAVRRTTLWRIAFAAFALGWTAAASALSCEGGKSDVQLPGPSSITVSPGAPAGTQLTGWFTGEEDPSLYHCTAGAGNYGYYSMKMRYAGSGSDTGIRVFFDGTAIPVVSTNIDGIGIAVAARVAFETYGWKYWMQGMGYPSNDVLSAVEVSGRFFNGLDQGAQVSYQLVKTKDGPVNTGEVSSLFSRISATPTGTHNPQPAGSWTETRYFLSPIRIIPLTCKTQDVTVNMGNVGTSAFHGPGTTAKRRSFSIALTDCPAGIQGIEYTLDPVTPIIDADQGIVGLDGGGATGVGLQLLDVNGRPVPLQREVRLSGYVPGSASADIPLQAAYYQTADTVTPGQADAAVRFTITYQ